ncbi:MAG: hypothetical protein A2V86_15050 [Deltaproteobacteria bacterium RBG_16_49_23]|nr:MAG: hypothetical protein A2V86_15050 [Deltaproteobacteria bacterium RBG_16_49_23]
MKSYYKKNIGQAIRWRQYFAGINAVFFVNLAKYEFTVIFSYRIRAFVMREWRYAARKETFIFILKPNSKDTSRNSSLHFPGPAGPNPGLSY